MNATKFFTKEEQATILDTIRKTEEKTSIEIRVHLEAKHRKDIYDHAAYIFKKLKMHETRQRNGILFYLALPDKKFVVLGDIGVNQKAKDHYWEKICDCLKQSFAKGKFADGLISSIVHCGETFKPHFPYKVEDIDELPNTIST